MDKYISHTLECIHTHTHTMEYYSGIKKHKSLPFAATNGLGGHYTKWNKVRQRKTNTVYHV